MNSRLSQLILFVSIVFFNGVAEGVAASRAHAENFMASRASVFKTVCAQGESDEVKAGESWRFIAKLKANKKGALKSCWGSIQGVEPTETVLPIRMGSCKICDWDNDSTSADSECKKLLLHMDKNELGIIGTYHFPPESPGRIYELKEVGIRPFNAPPTAGMGIRRCNSNAPLRVKLRAAPSGIGLFSLEQIDLSSLSGSAAKKAYFGESFYLKLILKTAHRITHGRLTYALSQGISDQSRPILASSIIYPGQLPGNIVQSVKQTVLSKDSIEIQVNVQVPSVYVQAREFYFQSITLQTETMQEITINLRNLKAVQIMRF